MAENGNRGPNDFRSRNGKKRREPPIIDASATEIPVEATVPEADAAPDTTSVPRSETNEPAAQGEPVLFGGPRRESTPREAAPESPDAAVDPLEAASPPSHVSTDGPSSEAPPTATFGAPASTAAEPALNVSSDDVASTVGSSQSLAGTTTAGSDRPVQDAAGPDPVAPGAIASPAMSDRSPDERIASRPAAGTGRDRSPDYVPPAARPGMGPIPGVLGVVALVLLGIIGWLVYSEPQRSGRDATAAALADLKAKVAALEARQDPAQLRSQIQGSVSSLDQKVTAADADRTGLAKTVEGLSTRLDAVAREAEAAKTEAGKSTAAIAAAGASPAGDARSGAPVLASLGAVAALAAKLDGLDGRVASLAGDQGRTAKAVADLPKPVPPDFGPVNARVAALDGQIKAAGDKLAAADARETGDLAAVTAKANASDARFNGFDAKVNGIDGKVNAFDARANAIDTRLNALEGKVTEGTVQLGKLQTAEAAQLATLQTTIAAQLGQSQTATNDQLAKVRTTIAELPKVDLGPLQNGQKALDARVAKVEGQLAASKDGARVTEARAVGSADETRATPIALVGQTIVAAIADGRPYGPDLQTLKALGVEPDTVARLEPLAANGAPTASTLKDQWNGVVDEVMAAVKPPESANPLDRFASSARNLVQVKRVGAVQGDDPAARVSQVGASLDDGDVPAALAAWDKIPAAGQAKSKGWAAAARAGAEAEAAAQGLVSRAIATLGRNKT